MRATAHAMKRYRLKLGGAAACFGPWCKFELNDVFTDKSLFCFCEEATKGACCGGEKTRSCLSAGFLLMVVGVGKKDGGDACRCRGSEGVLEQPERVSSTGINDVFIFIEDDDVLSPGWKCCFPSIDLLGLQFFPI